MGKFKRFLRTCKRCGGIFYGQCKGSTVCENCKMRCKAITETSGRRCMNEAIMHGYCTVHFKIYKKDGLYEKPKKMQGELL